MPPLFPAFRKLLVTALWLVMLALGPAWGQVTTTYNSGAGSLRAAVYLAAPGATITFDPSLDGETIYLDPTSGGGVFQINKNLILDASSLPKGITLSLLSGSGSTSVVEVLAGAVVELKSINILRGAGVINRGSLTMTACKVSFATTLGAVNLGTLALRGCMIANNSGYGLVNAESGILTVEDSTISDNGGIGIESIGDSLTLRRCAISGNKGLKCIRNWRGNALIADSSIFGNSNDIYNGSDGTLHLRHSTVAGNPQASPAIYNEGELTLENSIVANSITNGSYEILGTYAAMGVNIVKSQVFSAHSGTGVVLSVDPLLGSPGDFGGPTKSLRPQPNSPAVDAAASMPGDSGLDQRGFPRLVGPAPDIGAVELGEIRVTTAEDQSDGLNVNGVSLREALAVNTPGQAEVIRFDPAVFPARIQLSNGVLAIGRNVGIDARDIAGDVIIDAGGLSQVLQVGSEKRVALRGLSITGGGGGSNGNGVYFSPDSSGLVERCVIHSNSGRQGGGILSYGDLAIVNSTIAGNTASSDGGGIYIKGNLSLIHTTVSGNAGLLYSTGGIRQIGGRIDLRNSIVAKNESRDIFGGYEYRDFSGGSAYFAGKNMITNVTGTGYSNPTSNMIVGDPLLAPLARYGSAAPSMPPLPGSPAIEGAAPWADSPPTDQHGRLRPVGALPDIGAVEALPWTALGLSSVDGDAIPDLLEGEGRAYAHLSPLADDSEVDADGDGRTDAEELACMTNPGDPGDFFRVVSVKPGAGFDAELHPILEVTVSTFPGLRYHLASGAEPGGLLSIQGSEFTAEGLRKTVLVTLPAGHRFLELRTGGVPD